MQKGKVSLYSKFIHLFSAAMDLISSQKELKTDFQLVSSIQTSIEKANLILNARRQETAKLKKQKAKELVEKLLQFNKQRTDNAPS